MQATSHAPSLTIHGRPFEATLPVWSLYVIALLFASGTLLFRLSLTGTLGNRTFMILFMFPIILSAWLGGWWVGVFCTALVAAMVDYTLIPSQGGVWIHPSHDLLTWSALIVNGLLVSGLCESLHRAHRRAHERWEHLLNTQQQLRESDDLFETSFNQANLGIALIAANGRWMRVNAALCELLGYPIDQLLAMDFPSVVQADDRHAASIHLGQLAQGKITRYSKEKRLVRRDGTVFWVNFTIAQAHHLGDQTDYFVAIFEDIEARKLAEARAKQGRAQLSSFVSAAPYPLAMFDRDMTYLACSASWATQFVPGHLNPVGKNHYAVHVDIPEEWILVHQRGLAGETLHKDEDFWVQKDGSRHWVSWSVVPWRNELGEVGGILIASEEVTARKLAQEHLESSNALLEQRVQERTLALQRTNQELDDFAYIASHDLKEPLRGLYNYTNFLQEDCAADLNEDGKAYLLRMQRLVERLTTLIDSLLRYSRLGRGELVRRPIDMEKMLHEVLEDIAVFLRDHGASIIHVNPLPTIECDANLAAEVWQNLICNAAKYNDQTDKRIEVGCQLEGDVPVFFVRDNGIGIPPHHQENIFKIFKRLHKQEQYSGGVGAGLTIVKKIIDRHEGHIWLTSEVGAGTTFYFTFSSKEIA